MLAPAAHLRPERPRYSYVYAVALYVTGTPPEAIRVLEEAYTRHPYNREILSALVTFHRELGNLRMTAHYAAQLRALAS